MSHFERIGQ